MKFTVYELPKAKSDKDHIFAWLFERSAAGAAAWLKAYDPMVHRLEVAADSFAIAQENDGLKIEVREVLFKTRRGRHYRAVFHLEGANAYILRIRGPGQAPISDEQLR